MQERDVRTLLRLATGVFYAQGVKADMIFFDSKPANEKPCPEKFWINEFNTNNYIFVLRLCGMKKNEKEI